ncbi:MAG: LPS export ABC transporter periplasmic protein LptC [Gammaproteobacteria bacterium]|nr:LPS export ABC transporter periplasmic protein LptC [Gammaproteobacteria bacterium]
MSLRLKLTLVLLGAALLSATAVNWLGNNPGLFSGQPGHYPDYYMENFSTLTMEQDGRPKNRLNAEYMAHYPDDDTIELTRPRLEIFRQGEMPIIITSDKGWVTSDNKVILLSGKVDLWQDDHEGERQLEVNTSEVRVLLDQDYAETDRHATIRKLNTIVDADGVRAYFKQNRLELLDNVRGKIEPNKKG